MSLLGIAALAGCGPDELGDAASPPEARDVAPAARLHSSIDSAQVSPGHVARLQVRGGRLVDVSLRTADGTAVAGRSTDDAWRQIGRLVPATRYVLAATAANRDGATTERSWRFRTAQPAQTDAPVVSPVDGAEVGVGHPVVVTFGHDVVDKTAVEAGLRVETDVPVTGAWGWIDDRTVAYRPRTFWPGETSVSVHLDLAGTELQPGVWVMADRRLDFEIGRSQVLRISDATHTMTVERDGTAIRSVPVSMGKDGFTTRSGVKVIMTREVSRRMDSSTVDIGGAEAYDLEVPYAMRLTATGEFIHGAPWSEYAQGSTNVSHGCTNVSLADAIWLYDNSLIGDPVVTTGTGRPTEEWNGLGGIWNYSWDEWVTRSAR
jgi:lipoprotein-anchoring transpeptidase ErfK/SrfK